MLFAIHGFTGSDLSWSNILETACIDHQAILLPGHGWAPCPEGTTIASVAADIAAKMPDDGSADLVGYSMGGRVALRIALDYPEKVRRLILVSASSGIEDDTVRAERLKEDIALSDILEEDGIGTFIAWWEKNPVLAPAPGCTISRSAEESLRSQRLNNDAVGLAAAIRCLGQGQMEPLWSRLSTLAMPCLLLTGTADKVYSDIMQRMQKDIPRSHFMHIEKAGHAVHREQPKELVKCMLDFLISPTALL